VRPPLHALRTADGFSVTSALCAVAVGLTVTSTSLTGVSLARDLVRADAEAAVVVEAVLTARTAARARHETLDVALVAPDVLRMTTASRQGPSPADVTLGDGFSFLPTGVPRASRAEGRSIAAMSTLAFDVRGRLERDSGETFARAIVLGRPGSPLTSRALVIADDGTSVDTYRWNGAEWRR
jgi:hypothetical protein